MGKPARRPKAPVLQLVPRASDQDTIGALLDLLAEAHRGDIVGIAYVALRRGKYSVGMAGEVRRTAMTATLARGAVRVLDEELAKVVRG